MTAGFFKIDAKYLKSGSKPILKLSQDEEA